MGDHLKSNMMYYDIYLYHGNKYTYHCVITQTLQNGQTLGQFFELLYSMNVSFNQQPKAFMTLNGTPGVHIPHWDALR